MTKKCKTCGSTQVTIELQEGSLLRADVSSKEAIIETTFREYSNPHCSECEEPREDITDEDMERIGSWG